MVAHDQEGTSLAEEIDGRGGKTHGVLPARKIEDKLQLDHRQEGSGRPKKRVNQQRKGNRRPQVKSHHDNQPV